MSWNKDRTHQNFTLFINRTKLRPRNNFRRKELKIMFILRLTNTNTEYLFFLLLLQLIFFNQITWVKLLQRGTCMNNHFIVFLYKCFYSEVNVQCSSKTLTRDCPPNEGNMVKNMEMNHWLISDVRIWKLMVSLVRREHNCLSCLYVIEKGSIALGWQSAEH